MYYTKWTIESNEFETEKRQSKDALFTVGNGYFGIRGFFEEDDVTKVGNGGIYVAGIVGKGEHRTYTGNSRELCNISHILRLNIFVNNEKVIGTNNISDFSRKLDMKTAVYTRKYIWNKAVSFELSRFADMKNVHRIGQRIIVKSLTDNNKINLSALIDTDVVNLNAVSCEPLPIQPGRNHIVSRKIDEYMAEIGLDDEDSTKVYMGQKVCGYINNEPIEYTLTSSDMASGVNFDVLLNNGDELVVNKIVAVYNDKYEENAKDEVKNFLKSDINFDDMLVDSCKEWEKRWSTANIDIETDTDDDTAVRYNLFELMCSCPMHTDKVSIGARGLTGEMYEGCVFWDNEIFQIPFFTYSDPESAKRLLSFRYHTLEQAKKYAKELRMESGAQYPWQVSEKGIEQTESYAGFYSVHIIADIVYAIKNYVYVSGDNEFLINKGAEILIETSRFWVQRCIYSDFDGYYHLMTVRGPNEYSPIVDDNAFTNCMVADSLKFSIETLKNMKANSENSYRELCKKVGFNYEETVKWKEIADNLYVCYDQKNNIVAEYPTYFNRYPFDIKKYKPTAKRILESGTDYEYLYFYQITKQADAVLLMCLLPELFSDVEKKATYEYYEPRTVHDSSLSYAPHVWLAARLGKIRDAYEYFVRCAYLDITDMKLNTVSGIHFANFGGTWLSVVFGFCGISYSCGKLTINPNLPKEWKSIKLNLCCQGEIIHIKIKNDGVSAFSNSDNSKVEICICK